MKYDGDIGRFIYRLGHEVDFKHPLAVEPSGPLLVDHSKDSHGHHEVVHGPIKCKNVNVIPASSDEDGDEPPQCLTWPGKARLLLTKSAYDESKVTCYQ